MIYSCPFCGRKISRAIRDGITTCNNCSRVFDSSSYHRILAAAWVARLQDMYNIEALQASLELTDCEASIIQKYVIEKNFNHDELIKVIPVNLCS